MADEPNQDQEVPSDGQSGNDAVVTRPDYIPETIWDGEKNAPKIDLAATLAEHETFKTQATERAAKVPASPEAYVFDLPKDFELPAGVKWQADPKDPLVIGVREMAAANKWTQDELSSAVAVFAKVEAEKLKTEQTNQSKFADEQTKALGEKAESRRGAAKTWIDGNLSKSQAGMFSTLLEFKDGVEAVEAIIDKLKGAPLRGNPGDSGPENKNAEMAENVGKPGGAMALLRAGNEKK